MDKVVYSARVRRRRGQWEVWVPTLPKDAPRERTSKLANAGVNLAYNIATYLGVSEQLVEVDVRQPRRPKRGAPLRQRLSAGAIQAACVVTALGGVYAAAGAATTLILGGVIGAAYSVLHESGRI